MTKITNKSGITSLPKAEIQAKKKKEEKIKNECHLKKNVNSIRLQ